MARGRKPYAHEMVIPRRAHEFFERGKVTARYSVRLGKGKTLAAVRVHAFPGHAVFHFSVDEFNRLFRPEKERA
jgi:hypothetical protein